jgi:CDP-diacylglycerol--glycerol-3-phosphate 3-phosphatidyltransferase
MLLVVPVIFALKNHHQGFLVFLIFIGLISDALDGFFARKLNQITELGKVLDPLADKINIGAVVLVLIFEYNFPFWLAIAIIVRDIIIVIGSVILSKHIQAIPPSNFLGKIAVNVIALDLIGYIFEFKIFIPILDYIALFFVFISLLGYINTFIITIRETQNG